MYYSAGTYEAFARPEKPEGADRKSAYIIGTGLAGLSAAFYLVRDGQVKGEHIHLLEKLDLAGGSCDGRKDVRKGFYMRGGREMDNHFECMQKNSIEFFTSPKEDLLQIKAVLCIEEMQSMAFLFGDWSG